MARHGMARRGQAWHGRAGQGYDSGDGLRNGSIPLTRFCTARRGTAGRDVARQGVARRGRAWQGEARRGKGTFRVMVFATVRLR